MGMTLVEKILAAHSDKESVKAGDNIWIDVDKLLTHDVTGPGSIAIFEREFGKDAKVWDKNKIIIIPDHYIFTKDKYAMRNLDTLKEFATKQDITHYYEPFTGNYKGVCHVAIMEEGHLLPGEVMFGTDSHTCSSGAFGMFASGIGNTDAGFILGTGKLWVKVPETIRFTFNNKLPRYIMGKDIILKSINDIGFDGATYKTMQFDGDAISALNMDERMTICNMAIEAGGKNGIIPVDETTVEYVRNKTTEKFTVYEADSDASYEQTLTYDASKLEPMVAKPFSPGNGELAKNLSDTAITRAYLGSCTGGKVTDFYRAAEILYKKKVVVETFVVPATQKVLESFDQITYKDKTLHEIFKEAGCNIGLPSCAACLGGPVDTFGRTHAEEVVISTTNRNFVGRMGSKKAPIYLASPITVAASALTGHITDPRVFLEGDYNE